VHDRHRAVSDFRAIDEVELLDPGRASVYEHGWQSWSPTGLYRAGGTSRRPTRSAQQTMRFRPETPPPAQGFQAEGLLVVDPGDGGPVKVYTALDPSVAVASIRASIRGDTMVISADGPVLTSTLPERLEDALATVGDQLGAGMQARLRTATTVWCSWYHYFGDVTQDDVVENLDAIGTHDLPVTVVQVDDGWSAGIGDWLTLSGRFASLDQLAARIRDTGRRAGIWLAPFIAAAGSELARDHPDWLLGDAGYNWNEALYGLDLTHPGVQGYLRHVFEGLRVSGYDYFKLDFLYGGALPGERHAEQTAVQAYRSGLDVVRAAVGPDAYLVGCGAPMLPSIGRVDAMRVSSDTYDPSDADDGTDVLRGQASIEARAWQQGRLWVNDPDSLVARPGFAQRAAWADVIVRLGGLRSVSDRIRDLDARGLELTREVLSSAPPPTPFNALPELTVG
jgi:alpha-galactosidase